MIEPISSQFYRLLLRLYPRNFSRSHAAELERSFEDSMTVCISRYGRWAIPLAWVRILLDTVIHSVEQHLYERQTSRVAQPDVLLQLSWRVSMSNFLNEVRFAVRNLTNRPLFSATVVLTL